MRVDDLRADLGQAADAVYDAEAELERRRDELRALVLDASQLGIPATRIAELAGLSRITVGRYLRAAREDRGER